MFILVPEMVGQPALDRLSAVHQVRHDERLWSDRAALHDALAEADGLLVRNQTIIDADLLAAAPRLQVIGRHGVGLDTIDLDACSRAGVVVTYTPEENAVSVAELTIGLMLAVARNIVIADAAVRRGEWPRKAMTGVELHGRTLGLVGLGRIGYRVAVRARAFGMRVVAFDPYLPASAVMATECGAELHREIAPVLEQAEVLSIHLPLTPSTRGLLDQSMLSRLPEGAIVINTSRGEVLDETALVAGLRAGRIAGAGLDVRAQEPPVADDPLAQMANVVLTPHIAAFTVEGQHRVSVTVAEDMLRVLDGQPAVYYANLPRPVR